MESWIGKAKWFFVAGLALTACLPAAQVRVDAPLPGGVGTKPSPTPQVWEVIPITPTPRPSPVAEGEVAAPARRSYRNTPQYAQIRPAPGNPSQGCFEGGCHASLLQQAGMFVHAPFARGECRPCHDVEAFRAPHDQPHQDSEQDISLCYTCHPPESLGNSHPVDEGRVDPRTGGAFTCTSTCHDPHSDPYPGLLRFPPGGQLCILCHQEFSP